MRRSVAVALLALALVRAEPMSRQGSSERVGATVGITLSGGGVLVERVIPPFPAKTGLWCEKHVRKFARADRNFAAVECASDGATRCSLDYTAEAVFKFPVLPDDLRRVLIREAERTNEAAGGWTSDRHASHPTRDIPVSRLTNAEVADATYDRVARTVIPAAAALYSVPVEQLSVRDLFIVKYGAAPGEPCGNGDDGASACRGLEPHVDNAALSFNALLSDPAAGDFRGGGTGFEFLDWATLAPAAGEALLHSSSLRHSGVDVSAGVRYVLVGFLARNEGAVRGEAGTENIQRRKGKGDEEG
jgi:hypothetical protein